MFQRFIEEKDRLLPVVYFMGLVILTILLLGAGGEIARYIFGYNREEILNGQVWRIFTAHLVHLNEKHLLMNVLGMVLGCMVLLDVIEIRKLCGVFLVAGLGVSLGILLFVPEVSSYVGFSGLLHGIFSWGILQLLVIKRYFFGTTALLLLTSKIVYEIIQGPVPGAEEAIRGRILVESHLFGALGGVLAWGIQILGSFILRLFRKTYMILFICAVTITPNQVQAHTVANTVVNILVLPEVFRVMIYTHLEAFTLQLPLRKLFSDEKEALSQMSDEDLEKAADAASRYILANIFMKGLENSVIEPLRIGYPSLSHIRKEGEDLSSESEREALPIIVDFPRVANLTETALLVPQRLGAYTLIVIHEKEIVLREFVEEGGVSPGFQLGVEKVWYEQVREQVMSGFYHVLPLGYDHILFIVALTVGLFRLGPIILQATLFTLAHTITLALTSLGMIVNEPTLVEVGIALSLVVMGAVNFLVIGRALPQPVSQPVPQDGLRVPQPVPRVRFRLPKILLQVGVGRMGLVFFFGLLHGMGFASVFSKASSSLLQENLILVLASFNIGVELGQIAIIIGTFVFLIVFPLLLIILLRQIISGVSISGLRIRLRQIISGLVCVAGLFLVLERTGLLPQSWLTLFFT